MIRTKPCKKCGGVEFYTSNKCKKCAQIRAIKWQKENPEKAYIRKKDWAVKNPDKVNASHTKWMNQNPEKKKLSSRKWRENNKEQANQCSKNWALKNPEKRRSICNKWHKNNRAAIRIIDQNREARKRLSGGTLSKGLFDKLYKLQNGNCACCKSDLSKTKIHMDHIMPIALNGGNIDSNIQLLCQSCNQAKHSKHPIDFMQSRGFLL